MAFATTTVPNPTHSITPISASATALLAATLATSSPPNVSDGYIGGLVAQLFQTGYEIQHRSTVYDTSIGYALALPTTRIVEPDEWQELADLDDDWDAAGAKRISPDAIAHARRFLLSVPAFAHRFSPFPDQSGSVGLQAREAEKSAYMLVSPDNHFTYVIRVGAKTHRGTNIDAEEMKELLEFLY